MVKLTPTLPLDKYSRKWSGFKIQELYKGELVSVAHSADNQKAFDANFKTAFGKSPPKPNELSEVKGGFALWSGQAQYLLLLNGDNPNADLDTADKLGGLAYTTLQSDGWASLDIEGDRAYDVLERFIPLDLRGTSKQFATRTSAHHIAVIILKFSDTEIQLLTPRSSAGSFLEGLVRTVENVLS